MKYEAFKDGVRLSRLGFGAMRLPQTEPGPGKPIDQARAQEMVDLCMAQGVNYYDTAYIYHGGKSEEFLGRALAGYPRDSFYVADKFNIQANPDYRAQFSEQLSRLGMERIDFYLLHGVSELTVDDVLSCGCIPYFEEQQRQGRIRYLGFSFHGTPDCLRKLLDARDWDFVQIQLNYYDWFTGSAREQYDMLRARNIPIMVMEPVHGGMLANLSDECRALLPEGATSPASVALEFVMGLPGVAVVLSGMSNRAQVEENLATASAGCALTDDDLARLEKISRTLGGSIAVPCTACRYCCDNCPSGLDIPALLNVYNEFCGDAAASGNRKGSSWRLARLRALPEDKRPGACIGCGNCTAHCPQALDIPAYMKEMAQYLG